MTSGRITWQLAQNWVEFVTLSIPEIPRIIRISTSENIRINLCQALVGDLAIFKPVTGITGDRIDSWKFLNGSRGIQFWNFVAN